MINLSVNGTEHQLDLDPAMPLLWAIREHLGLTGTKYGCGIAQCGACTVHLNGAPVRSCSTPLSLANGGQVVTIFHRYFLLAITAGAMTAVAADEAETHELFNSDAARAYVAQTKRVKQMQAGHGHGDDHTLAPGYAHEHANEPVEPAE